MNEAFLPFESYGLSHRGCVRELNEDRYLIQPASGLWAVADGMGGHDAGEVASASIVDHLGKIGIATSATDLRARFEDGLHRAHEEIRSIARSRGVTIGSTVAALLVMDGRFACLWSGDSRVYLVRNGSITQVSRDHTEAQELLDRGLITQDEARTWPRKNVITQAVGVTDEVTMEFQYGDMSTGDVFILCTDGLTAHVDDTEIRAAVVSEAPRAACEMLVRLALARGGTDNVTVLVVAMRGAHYSGQTRVDGGGR